VYNTSTDPLFSLCTYISAKASKTATPSHKSSMEVGGVDTVGKDRRNSSRASSWSDMMIVWRIWGGLEVFLGLLGVYRVCFHNKASQEALGDKPNTRLDARKVTRVGRCPLLFVGMSLRFASLRRPRASLATSNIQISTVVKIASRPTTI